MNRKFVDKIPKNRIYFCRQNKFIWTSNPKVASSSMKAWILKNELRGPNLKTIGSKSEINVLAARNHSREEIISLFKELPKICFVRNPVKRFVSGYMNKIDRVFSNFKDNIKPKIEILKILGKDLSDVNQCIDLDEFIYAIDKVQNPENINKHFAPQVFSLFPEIIQYDFILKLEKIKFELLNLEKSTGIRIDLSENKKKTKRPKIDLTKRHREFIYSYFDIDYKTFGYSK